MISTKMPISIDRESSDDNNISSSNNNNRMRIVGGIFVCLLMLTFPILI